MSPRQRAYELRLAARIIRSALRAVEDAVEVAELPCHPIEQMIAAWQMAEGLDLAAAQIEETVWHA